MPVNQSRRTRILWGSWVFINVFLISIGWRFPFFSYLFISGRFFRATSEIDKTYYDERLSEWCKWSIWMNGMHKYVWFKNKGQWYLWNSSYDIISLIIKWELCSQIDICMCNYFSFINKRTHFSCFLCINI